MSSLTFAGTRPATRPVGTRRPARPTLVAPVAHPSRRPAPGPVGGAASCTRVTPDAAVSVSLAVRLKVAAVGLLAFMATAVSAAEFISWEQPDPAVDVVAGDPGWAHVTQS